MSRYTTQVRYIVDSMTGNDLDGFSSVDERIRLAAPKIFAFDWPIFDEAYRLPLECKILRHYYTREICAETFGLWQLFLDQKMNEIMPYYNRLYLSERLEFDPLENVSTERTTDIGYTHSRDASGEAHSQVAGEESSTGSGSSNSESKDAFSDTPQGGLTDVESLKYLTNYRNIKQDGSTKTEASGTSQSDTDSTSKDTEKAVHDEDRKETYKGKEGGQSYSSLLKEYRDTFLNIDQMVIKDLAPLFMGIFFTV